MSILVTGANGQIGNDLVQALARTTRAENIVTSDLQDRTPQNGAAVYEQVDVTNPARLREVVEEYDVQIIYHLASLLSVTGEKNPDRAWQVNVDGLKHVLDVARERQMQVFWPSSIAVFGAETPKESTPQKTVLDPTTIYGVTKVSGELLCRYYHHRFGVDVRSLRYPGLISYSSPPGGGTTDYAVEIFHAAAEGSEYECFVRPDTRLPMMYMPDAIRAALDLMNADTDRISIRTSYNISAVSFSAEEIAREIANHIPGFRIRYAPDRRQSIADSWPHDVDDSDARHDWGWSPQYDLEAIVNDMLAHLPREVSP